MTAVLIAVVVVVLLALVGWLAWTAFDLGSGLRRSRLTALAARRGWTFENKVVGVAQANFHGRPFDVGRDRTATHVLRGRVDGHEMVAFDYGYTTGKRREDQRSSAEGARGTAITVVALAIDPAGRTAPSVQVSPGRRIGRIVADGSGTEVQVGGTGGGDRLEVRTTDESFARAVLNPDVMSRLSGAGDRAWRLDGSWLVALRTGPLGVRRLTVGEVEETLSTAQELLRAGCSDEVRGRLTGGA